MRGAASRSRRVVGGIAELPAGGAAPRSDWVTSVFPGPYAPAGGGGAGGERPRSLFIEGELTSNSTGGRR